MTQQTGHLKITSDGTSRNTVIEIDGHRITNVKYVAFAANADHPLAAVTLFLQPVSIEIDAENVVIEAIPNNT